MKAWIAAGLGLALGSCKFDPPVDKLPIDGPPTARLTVTLIGGGPGRVTGGGVDCATGNVGTCAVDVPVGQRVTLTYAADTVGAGSQVVVDGWGGDCASRGTAATCEVVADVERVVTHGARLQHQVAVTLVASEGGQGMVTSTPAGLACASGTCNAFFDAGAEVTLTANPATPNDRVSTVTGDCSTMPCTLPALGGPRATTVTFLRSTCVPSTQTCTLGRFSQCDAEGNYVSYLVPNGAPDGTATTLVMNDYLCPLGCHATEPRCNDVDATNGLNAALDHPAVSPSGVDLVLPRLGNNTAGTITINTNAFDATRHEIVVTDTDGQPVSIPALRLMQSEAPDIIVLMVRSFTLRAGALLRSRGAPALAIASEFDIVLAGTIEVAARASNVVPSGSTTQHPICSGMLGDRGIGGGAGAAPNANGGHSVASTSTGGQRGLFPFLSPLRGGCDTFVPGPGGGAIQLVSRRRIALQSTGAIDVSGAGGICWQLGGPPSGASGAGGGGTVVMESPTAAIAVGGFIAGRGGSGAAADGGVCTFGNDGPTGPGTFAAPVACGGSTCTSGAGGHEGAPAGGNATATNGTAQAGGGGGAGLLRISTASGTSPTTANSRRIVEDAAGTLRRR
jgi:hypothetical protein